MRTGIALGSNLGDRLANLASGRDAITRIPSVAGPLLQSRVYQTEPIGTGPDAGSFLNAVIEIDYSGEAETLLHALREIERAHGRPERYPRNSPRTLDLDILYVDDLVSTRDKLILPHPRLHLRRFVLQPLSDIRAEFRPPGFQKPVAELLADLSDSSAVDRFATEW